MQSSANDEHSQREPAADTARGKLCLVTGASGYIGGRLVPELLAAGYRVRCLARTPDKLRDFPWAEQAEVVRGDVLDGEAVRHAMGGVNVAYYLVHALGSGDDFEETDRRAAGTSRTPPAKPGWTG